MIHRQSRNNLSQALRQYASGRITNDDLEAIEVDWRDRGAVAVQEVAWFLYDDTHQHTATGKYSLDATQRREIAKYVVFLHTNHEFIWPEYSFINPVGFLLNIFTFGWWRKKQRYRWQQYSEAGDIDAWPFISTTALNNAKESPKLLGSACAADQ